MASEAEDLAEYFNSKAELFNTICQERGGVQDFSFLGEDVITEMIETLADTVSICYKQAIKLMMLQDHLGDQLGTQEGLIKAEDLNKVFSPLKRPGENEWGDKR